MFPLFENKLDLTFFWPPNRHCTTITISWDATLIWLIWMGFISSLRVSLTFHVLSVDEWTLHIDKKNFHAEKFVCKRNYFQFYFTVCRILISRFVGFLFPYLKNKKKYIQKLTVYLQDMFFCLSCHYKFWFTKRRFWLFVLNITNKNFNHSLITRTLCHSLNS